MITRTKECSIYLWRTHELFLCKGYKRSLADKSDIPTKTMNVFSTDGLNMFVVEFITFDLMNFVDLYLELFCTRM